MYAEEKKKEILSTPSNTGNITISKEDYEILIKTKERDEREREEKENKKRSDLERQLSPSDKKIYEGRPIDEIERHLQTKKVGVYPEPNTDTSETGYPYMVWDETLGKHVWKRK